MISLVIGVVFLILFLNLRSRVANLESRLGMSSGVQPIATPQAPQAQGGYYDAPINNVSTPPGAPAGLSPNGMIPTPSMQAMPTPGAGHRFGVWLKEDWLLKLGVLLLIIGFGWLVTFAFMNDWIGPMGRIVFGLVSGALILALGTWRIRTYIHQGGIFLVFGSVVIILTVFAGKELYHFFEMYSSLGLMLLSIAFVAFSAVKYNSRALSLGCLILAGISPILSGVWMDEISLFSYLLVVVLGTIWIVALTGQRSLNLASLILVGLYSAPYLTSYKDQDNVLLFIYVFAMIFFIANTLGIIKNKDKDVGADLAGASLNGILLLTWIMVAAPTDWRSLIISAWMIVFSAGAFLTYRVTNNLRPFYIYAGIGVAMLASATSAELEGATLVIALTIESAIVTFLVHVITRNFESAEKTSLLLIGPIILSLESIGSYVWRDKVIHEHFFVLFVLGFVMFLLGLYFWQARKQSNTSNTDPFSVWLIVGGSVYFYILLWLSLHALMDGDSATMLSLFVYTIVGLGTYITGRVSGNKALSAYGGVLLGFVVGRLLVVDVWSMEMGGRIVTFFIIGILLISTAFIGRKKKVQINTTTLQ